MEVKRCFEPGCMLEVECLCNCTSPGTYSCELHFVKHLKQPNKAHAFESIFLEPCEGTKAAILEALAKKKSKYNKLKEKFLASFSQNLHTSKSSLDELINDVDSSSDKLNNWISKIMETKKLSKSEQDPILGLLCLQPEEAVEKINAITQVKPDWYNSAKLFCGFNEKIEKMIECFIQDKFEAYIDKRLMKRDSTLDEHKNAISIANSEIANVKDSISELIKENNKINRELEEWKKEIDQKLDNTTSVFSSQIASITENLNLNQKVAVSAIDIDTLREKTVENLREPNNPNLEMDFRKISSIYMRDFSELDPLSINAYQDYLSAYQMNSSLYNFIRDGTRYQLCIYNTETESKALKVLHTQKSLDDSTCIARLPNSRLFCYGGSGRDYSFIGYTVIIDENFEVQELPYGTHCACSSAIYFDNNVYCFGGLLERNTCNWSTLSNRFDLDRNQWIQLTPMPQDDFCCSSIILNRNIVISGKENAKLLRYSIDANSFTTISHDFRKSFRKILINAERLYLIECGDGDGSIYESEIGSDTLWRRIANSSIWIDSGNVYCSYNKGAIYIGIDKYFKFTLNQKQVTELL